MSDEDERCECGDKIGHIAACEFRRDTKQAADPWEWAEDRCQVCDTLLGAGLRFMHLGLCERCREAPKH